MNADGMKTMSVAYKTDMSMWSAKLMSNSYTLYRGANNGCLLSTYHDEGVEQESFPYGVITLN